jgi:hypothetical protein
MNKCEKDKEIIRNTPSEFGMIRHHHGLGTWVRNTFGLWRGNDELLRSTGCQHPDNASVVILGALWQRLSRGESVSKDIRPNVTALRMKDGTTRDYFIAMNNEIFEISDDYKKIGRKVGEYVSAKVIWDD